MKKIINDKIIISFIFTALLIHLYLHDETIFVWYFTVLDACNDWSIETVI